MATQGAYLGQVHELQQDFELEQGERPAIICAGDVFDRWNPPIELINWAHTALPVPMFSIPGQHDLPMHNLEDVHRSAYYTLCLSGSLDNLRIGEPAEYHLDDKHSLVIWGFPYGTRFGSLSKKVRKDFRPNAVHVAVVHHYVWQDHADAFPGAPDSCKVDNVMENLRGYDVVVFGDNHRSFEFDYLGCTYFNCGTFMRRKADEQWYLPSVGLLFSNGQVKRHYLDVKDDQFIEDDTIRTVETLVSTGKVMEDLLALGASSSQIEYTETVKHYLKSNVVPRAVKSLLLQSIEQQ